MQSADMNAMPCKEVTVKGVVMEDLLKASILKVFFEETKHSMISVIIDKKPRTIPEVGILTTEACGTNDPSTRDWRRGIPTT
mmetsp:Transcript_34295/g.60684  ORF Transcript_34295/g.60684 Transcript_34295/m.60684 type:complete len:82 (+) Transcript_34295:1174-1419(+)